MWDQTEYNTKSTVFKYSVIKSKKDKKLNSPYFQGEELQIKSAQ